jgi:N-acetylglucosamine-6-sulfatase
VRWARRLFAPLSASLLVIGLLMLTAGCGGETGASAEGGAEGTAAPASPNFVVIVTDDQTVAGLDAMPKTRALIGARGARFDAAYASFPLCCPARATLLTGQYAHNHGVLGNKPPEGGFSRFQELHGDSNLAVWMQQAGYRTVHIGKYFNGYGDDDPAFVPKGWDEWYGSTTPGQRVYNYRLNENGKLVSYGDAVADFKEDVLTEKAVKAIGALEDGGRPLYLSLAYTAPHNGGPNPSPQPPGDCADAPKPAPRHAHDFDDAPLPMPPSFNEADVSDKPGSIAGLPRLSPKAIEKLTRRWRCTLESLQSVDDGVADLVAALRKADALHDTYLIFISDNGLFFGEHRIPSGKVRHYEPASRVPLLIRGPGVRPGTVVKRPVVDADVAPTILAAAGVEPQLPQDGISLLRTLAGEPAPRRDILLESRVYAGIRTDGWVMVENFRSDDLELYDLRSDPGEQHNLAGDPAQAARIERLSGRLAELRECAGADCHPGVKRG